MYCRASPKTLRLGQYGRRQLDWELNPLIRSPSFPTKYCMQYGNYSNSRYSIKYHAYHGRRAAKESGICRHRRTVQLGVELQLNTHDEHLLILLVSSSWNTTRRYSRRGQGARS